MTHKERVLKALQSPDPQAPYLVDRAQATLARYGEEYLVTSYQKWLLCERA
jgi:hypothetical protein